MKVLINFTVDINEKTWARDYGLDPKEVRQDVKKHVCSGIHDHLYDLGLLDYEE
tara:strand:- start:89 stop:250 length:162 start_codon:yes stop_codon:yes gene_type:complete